MLILPLQLALLHASAMMRQMSTHLRCQHAAAASQGKDQPFSRNQVEAAFQQLEQQLQLEAACWVALSPDACPMLLSAGPSLQDSVSEQDCGLLLGPPSDPMPIQMMQRSALCVPQGAQPPPAPSLHYEPWPGTASPPHCVCFSLAVTYARITEWQRQRIIWQTRCK